MKYFFFILSNFPGLFLILIAVSSCKKKPVKGTDDCSYEYYSLPIFDSSHVDFSSQEAIYTTYHVGKYYYMYPVFNPMNPYEIAYIRENPATSTKELYKFSFCSGVTKKLTDKADRFLDWSSNG